MESLYRKYRPQTFESVVGQQHIVSTLEHAVREGRLSHAYLFCGPRGTGKTTMARILAKALLCENPHDHMPCGECAQCVEIAQGLHPDVYELDAASRTGVDNVREEIINSVSFAPVRGTSKLYIIDEVHMLTTAAFNALLKTLEEPPEHVVFVLATTDPQKVPETILSRCQRFDFHRIGNEDIVRRLRYICEQEGFETEDEALELVAKHARGGLRDALSTLEQLSVFGAGAVRLADARSLLGEVATSVLGDFARAIANRDVVELFSRVGEQVDEGNDLLELTRDLIGHMRDVYMVRLAGVGSKAVDATPEELAALADEASLFESADRLARVLSVLDDAAVEMRVASDPRLVLEVAFTRLARPEADLTLEALAERLDRLEHQIAMGAVPGPVSNGSGVGSGAAAVAASAPATAPANATVSHADGQTANQAPSGSSLPWAEKPAPATGLPWEAPTPVPAQVAPSAAVSSASTQGAAAAPTQQPAAAIPAAAAQAESGPRAAAPAAPVQQPTATAPAPASQVAAPSGSATTPSPDPSDETGTAPLASEAPRAGVTDKGELQRKWAEAVSRVVAQQPSRGALLQSSRALSDDGETLKVGFPAGSTFAIKMLGRADSHAIVVPIVCGVFGPRELVYIMDDGPSSPAATAPAPRPAPHVAASQAVSASAAQANASQEARPVDRFAQSSAAQVSAPAERASMPLAAQATVAVGRETASVGNVAASSPAGDAPAAHAAMPWEVAPASAPTVDHVSGPTPMPEPVDIEQARRDWENGQVPYDDDMIAAYEDDAASAPPVHHAPVAPDLAPSTAATSVPVAPTSVSDGAVHAPEAAASQGFSAPWESAAQEAGPVDEGDVAAILGSVFGEGVKLTEVPTPPRD